jgi:hypothetical protein
MRGAILIFALVVAACASAKANTRGPAPLGPSFDCERATDTLSRIICGNDGLRRRDLELTQAYYTLRFALPERSEPLRQEALAFQRGIRSACTASVVAPPAQDRLPPIIQCASDRMRDQRAAWLAQLRQLGNRHALEEAERPIEQHMELQSSLRAQGFLARDAQIDGTFGPATRAAIRAAQRQGGVSADGFLSATAAAVLVAPRVANLPNKSDPTAPPPGSSAPSRQGSGPTSAVGQSGDFSPGTCAALGLVAQMGVRVREQGWSLPQALELATVPHDPSLRRRYAAAIRFAYGQPNQAQAHENAVFECFSRRL